MHPVRIELTKKRSVHRGYQPLHTSVGLYAIGNDWQVLKCYVMPSSSMNYEPVNLDCVKIKRRKRTCYTLERKRETNIMGKKGKKKD